jgi:DNA helicase-2/ATP-dependent DNA helicase PcrA
MKRDNWENTPASDLKQPSAAPTASTLPQPSPHQQAYYDWIARGRGNASLVAVAGAGKTTTLLGGAQRMPKGTRGYAVVFNKKNADELKARFPSHVVCGTFHSLWMRAVRANLGNNVKIEDTKTANMIMRVLPTEQINDHRGTRLIVARTHRDYVAPIKQLVGLAKNAGVGLLMKDTEKTYLDMIDHHGMEFDLSRNESTGARFSVSHLIEYTQRVLELSRQDLKTIDFDDMLYLPLLFGWTIEQRDFVFVDEAQDSNAVQRALVARMVKKDGRIVFVGDPHQAIYGFRGATNDAMATIHARFKTTELPLTVSFRCPKAVVKYAQQYVSHIESHADALDGEVTRVDGSSGALKRAMLTPDTAVVCRTTAPLVSFAFKMIGKRIPCKILGRDIGTRLLELARRMQARSLDDLISRLEAYRVRQLAIAEAKDDEALAQMISDQVASLTTIVFSMPPHATLDDVYGEISNLFTHAPNATTLTLCTVHKAKGLEWPRVVIIRPDLMPLPWVKKDWQLEQEKNIAYVAATRAKQQLVIVDGVDTPEIGE